jgi:orotate phosphoribosyltransferase
VTDAPKRGALLVAPGGRTWWNSSVDQLLELLRSRGFRRGHFVLSSGKESDFFIDCKPAVLLAEGHVLVGRALLGRIADTIGPVAAVAGVELGGCPLASAVAFASWTQGPAIDAVYIRKSSKAHGTRKMLEGADHLARGARLVIVEDTVTTGGSTLRAAEAVTNAGFEVAGVVAVVDRLEGGGDAIRSAGFAFSALFDRTDFMGEG